MQGALLPPLAVWQNFYVIIGSAAATLTGLMFVVITLIVGMQVPRTDESFAAFGTPNVAHFCAALLVAATLSAPWPAIWNVSLPLGLCGLAGVTYILIVFRRVRHQTIYQPVLEDWLWHTALPLISYTTLVVSAIALPGFPTLTLFFVGAATILFLFIGIHNAWDAVTYMTVQRPQLGNRQKEDQ